MDQSKPCENVLDLVRLKLDALVLRNNLRSGRAETRIADLHLDLN